MQTSLSSNPRGSRSRHAVKVKEPNKVNAGRRLLCGRDPARFVVGGILREKGGVPLMDVQPSAQVTRQQLLRAVIASTVGTSIEWYDFFLYGSAAALVFG